MSNRTSTGLVVSVRKINKNTENVKYLLFDQNGNEVKESVPEWRLYRANRYGYRLEKVVNSKGKVEWITFEADKDKNIELSTTRKKKESEVKGSVEIVDNKEQSEVEGLVLDTVEKENE